MVKPSRPTGEETGAADTVAEGGPKALGEDPAKAAREEARAKARAAFGRGGRESSVREGTEVAGATLPSTKGGVAVRREEPGQQSRRQVAVGGDAKAENECLAALNRVLRESCDRRAAIAEIEGFVEAVAQACLRPTKNEGGVDADATSVTTNLWKRSEHIGIDLAGPFNRKGEGAPKDSPQTSSSHASLSHASLSHESLSHVVTYILNRTVICLASDTPHVRENATYTLTALLAVWLRRTENPLLSKNGCLTTLTKAVRKHLSIDQNTRPEQARLNTVGELIAYRVFFEHGLFAAASLANFKAVVDRLESLMNTKGFILFGADLAAELLARLCLSVGEASAKTSLKTSPKTSNSYFDLGEKTEVVKTSLTEIAKGLQNVIDLHPQNMLTMKTTQVDSLVLLLPKTVTIMRLFHSCLSQDTPLDPALLAPLLKRVAQPNLAQKFVVNSVYMATVVSAKKNVALTSLWPSLFGLAVRWTASPPYHGGSAETPLSAFCKAVDELCGKSIVQHLFVRIVHFCCWFKALRIAAQAPGESSSLIAPDDFYRSLLLSGPNVRKVLLQSLAQPSHPCADISSFLVRALEALLSGADLPPSDLWAHVIPTLQVPEHGGSKTARKRQQNAFVDQIFNGTLKDTTPLGLLAVLEYTHTPLHIFDPTLGATDQQSDGGPAEFHRRVFATKMALEPDTSAAVREAFLTEAASLRLGGSSKLFRRLLALFPTSGVTAPATPGAAEKQKQAKPARNAAGEDQLDSFRLAATGATAGGSIETVLKALEEFAALNLSPDQAADPATALELRQMFGDLVSRFKRLLLSKKPDLATLKDVLKSLSTMSGSKLECKSEEEAFLNLLTAPRILLQMAQSKCVVSKPKDASTPSEMEAMMDEMLGALGDVERLRESLHLEDKGKCAENVQQLLNVTVTLPTKALNTKAKSTEAIAAEEDGEEDKGEGSPTSFPTASASKIAKSMNCVFSLAQRLVEVVTERIVSSAENADLEPLWDLVLSQTSLSALNPRSSSDDEDEEDEEDDDEEDEEDDDDEDEDEDDEDAEDEQKGGEKEDEIEEEGADPVSKKSKTVADQADCQDEAATKADSESDTEEIEVKDDDELLQFLIKDDESMADLAAKHAAVVAAETATKRVPLEEMVSRHRRRCNAVKTLENLFLAQLKSVSSLTSSPSSSSSSKDDIQDDILEELGETQGLMQRSVDVLQCLLYQSRKLLYNSMRTSVRQKRINEMNAAFIRLLSALFGTMTKYLHTRSSRTAEEVTATKPRKISSSLSAAKRCEDGKAVVENAWVLYVEVIEILQAVVRMDPNCAVAVVRAAMANADRPLPPLEPGFGALPLVRTWRDLALLLDCVSSSFSLLQRLGLLQPKEAGELLAAQFKNSGTKVEGEGESEDEEGDGRMADDEMEEDKESRADALRPFFCITATLEDDGDPRAMPSHLRRGAKATAAASHESKKTTLRWHPPGVFCDSCRKAEQNSSKASQPVKAFTPAENCQTLDAGDAVVYALLCSAVALDGAKGKRHVSVTYRPLLKAIIEATGKRLEQNADNYLRLFGLVTPHSSAFQALVHTVDSGLKLARRQGLSL